MRVLQINDYPDGGGAEVLMHRTIALLRDRGCEVRAFTAENVPGHRRTALGYISSRQARRALERTLSEFKPDVVHLHNFYHELSPGILTLFASRARWPGRVVMTAHDAHLVCPNSGLCCFGGGVRRVVSLDELKSVSSLLRHRWDHRGAAHSTLKLAQHVWNYRRRDRRAAIDLIICPSRFMQRCMQLVGRPTALLPHPVPRANSHSSRPVTLQLAFAGRVEPEKGIADFLDALPADFPGRIIIIGEGADLARCRSIVAQHNLTNIVEFKGRLAHETTIEIISQSHVLILPSLVPENCPMSLLEALAVGTNILATDLGGSPEIVQQAATGFLFSPGDSNNLRDALDRVVAAHEAGELNSFDAGEFLESRSEDAHVDALLRLYDPAAAS